MKRCILCRRLIWPWQRIGWKVRADGSTDRWHGDCYREREGLRR